MKSKVVDSETNLICVPQPGTTIGEATDAALAFCRAFGVGRITFEHNNGRLVWATQHGADCWERKDVEVCDNTATTG